MPIPAPNWQEARQFLELLAGERDPIITFQTFGDKAEDFTLASICIGKPFEKSVRDRLLVAANEGCGIFYTLNKTDGKGRRRANMIEYRVVGLDLDGAELPEDWATQPHIIIESSPGKFHVLWLLQPGTDFNAWSDCQVRIATYYGGDRRVFDPPRVFRLPGFYHQKGKPFRSRILEKCSFEIAQFDRLDLAEFAAAHECDYDAPGERKERGKSDEPVAGWDAEADILRAEYLLTKLKKPTQGDRNNSAYRAAALLNDYAISPEKSLELLGAWNDTLDDPLPIHEIEHVLRSAPEYKASPAGSKAIGNPDDDFDDDISEAELAKIGEPNVKAEDWPPPEKSKGHEIGGVSFQFADQVEMEPIEWLWENRFAIGKMNMIAGFPDQGKSQILCSIAAAVTTGGQWPNREGKAEMGGVMILSAEDSAHDILVPRLEAAGADLSKVIIVKSMVKVVEEGRKTTRVLNIADDLKKLQAMMNFAAKRGLTIRAIMIDPLNAYFGGAAKADSHKAADMRALLTPISEWCADKAVAVIGISHFNKGSNTHVLYRVTDSAAITAVCRAVWYAIRDESEEVKTDEIFYLLPGKKNIGKRVKGLEYTIKAKIVQAEPIIEAPFIEWGGEAKVSASEVLGVKATATKGATDEAVKFLQAHLKDGPKSAKWLLEEGQPWISKSTMERARTILGLKPFWSKKGDTKESMLSLQSLHDKPDPASEFEDDERDVEDDDSIYG